MAKATAMRDVDRLHYTGLATDPVHLIARLRAMSKQATNRALAALDIDIRQYAVLSLAASGEAPTQREISDFTDLDARQIVYLVDRLSARRLVERRPDDTDRRANRVVATQAGEALLAEARILTEQATATCLANLTASESTTLTALLAKVTSAS